MSAEMAPIVQAAAAAGGPASSVTGAGGSAAAAPAAAPSLTTTLTGATARGITLRGLDKIEEHLKQLVADGHFKKTEPIPPYRLTDHIITDYMELTTTSVVYNWIKDESVTGTKRLADCADLIDPRDVGPPRYFVSHAWKGRFAKLVAAVRKFLRNASDDTLVWIDCFAVQQHRETMPDENAADVACFEDTIKQCNGGIIVVVDMAIINPALRGWCL
jgi:hypothetical protein